MSQHLSEKLEARALQTVFVGYLPHQKGHKLYDPIHNFFHVSRHVIFDKSVLSFDNTPVTVFPYFTHNSHDMFDNPSDDLDLDSGDSLISNSSSQSILHTTIEHSNSHSP